MIHPYDKFQYNHTLAHISTNSIHIISFNTILNNTFAALDDQYSSAETAKSGQNGTQPAKNNRVFIPKQIEEYEERKTMRELKADQEADRLKALQAKSKAEARKKETKEEYDARRAKLAEHRAQQQAAFEEREAKR